MSDYIGTREQVDEYVGSRLVEAAYLGSRKYYDAYSEVSGSLPLVYESRVEHILKNYALYGTASGAGTATENLFDSNQTVKPTGKSPYVEFISQGTYAVKAFPVQAGYLYAGVYENGERISRVYYILAGATGTLETISVDTGQTLRLYDPLASRLDRDTCISRFNDYRPVVLYSDSSTPAFPDSYIPYGYQLQLANTSGQHTDTYPLYIGSSKLGAEEYLDYESGKVYKRTENNYNLGVESGAWGFSSDGTIQKTANNKRVRSSDVLELDVNGDYLFEVFPSTLKLAIMTLNDDKTLKTDYGWSSDNYHIITPAANYCVLSVKNENGTAITPERVTGIVVAKNQATPLANFVPYYQPTDPPVPLPAITAYQGENTLSSTETVGTVTVKGRINEPST